MFKSLLAVFVLALSIGSAHANAVPHTMVGGVIVQTLNGSTKFVQEINYNVPFSSEAKCLAAIDTVKLAGIPNYETVTNGWNTSIYRAVLLQCVAR